MERATFDVTRWFGKRWKGQIFVDRHPVEKAYFDTYYEALDWCLSKQHDYNQEVR